MLGTRTSTLRDWGLFVLVALLPAVAIGLLGLRALVNEEAAIKREMRISLERAAEEARRRYEMDLEALESGRLEITEFADPLSIAPLAAAEELPGKKPASVEPGVDCRALAKQQRQRAEARREFLKHCETARSSSGRWLWLVVALGPDSGVDEARIEAWLRDHGAELSMAERAAARSELTSPKLVALLEGDASSSSDAPLTSAERYAMRMGRPRIAWSHDGARGLLVRGEDETYRGYIIHPRSMARALRQGWLSLPPGMTARLIVGQTPASTAFFEMLEGGALVEIVYADPSAVEARTARSKRILIGVAALAFLVAIGLVALVFARMRRERRVGALRTDFVAAVSHELRTPIASIRMLSELLADGHVDDDHEQQEMHRALAKEAKRLGETVNRLLGFSRMEAGKQTVQRTQGVVAEPVLRAIATLEERHPDERIDSELDDTISAPIDAEAIEMAVENLLTNAFKYARPPICVRLFTEGKGVRIEVIDAGPGLAKRDQQRIFRPFERADDRLSEATEGSGIGLSLVRHVARSHRGRAGVHSEPGSGSTFFLWIPTSEDGLGAGGD